MAGLLKNGMAGEAARFLAAHAAASAVVCRAAPAAPVSREQRILVAAAAAMFAVSRRWRDESRQVIAAYLLTKLLPIFEGRRRSLAWLAAVFTPVACELWVRWPDDYSGRVANTVHGNFGGTMAALTGLRRPRVFAADPIAHGAGMGLADYARTATRSAVWSAKALGFVYLCQAALKHYQATQKKKSEDGGAGQQTLLIQKNVEGEAGFGFLRTSVTSVQKGGAAEAAGMKVGMAIVAFAGVPVHTERDLADVEVPRGGDGSFPVVVIASPQPTVADRVLTAGKCTLRTTAIYTFLSQYSVWAYSRLGRDTYNARGRVAALACGVFLLEPLGRAITLAEYYITHLVYALASDARARAGRGGPIDAAVNAVAPAAVLAAYALFGRRPLGYGFFLRRIADTVAPPPRALRAPRAPRSPSSGSSSGAESVGSPPKEPCGKFSGISSGTESTDAHPKVPIDASDDPDRIAG